MISVSYLYLGEIDTVFEFGRQDDINKFVVTSDSDHNEGYSQCSLKINQSGYGLFSGVLDSTVPKQGRISRAGYCNITSLRVKVCLFWVNLLINYIDHFLCHLEIISA